MKMKMSIVVVAILAAAVYVSYRCIVPSAPKAANVTSQSVEEQTKVTNQGVSKASKTVTLEVLGAKASFAP